MTTAQTVARIRKWWAEDYFYAVKRMVRGLPAGSPSNHLSGEKRPVIIVSGVWESWTFLVPVIKPLHVVGHPVRVIAGLGWNTQSVIETAQKVADHLETRDLRDVVVIAHGNGGLVGRCAMNVLDDQRLISSTVAIWSPFSGSRYAPYFPIRSIRAFSPGDPTTGLLKRGVSANARICSPSRRVVMSGRRRVNWRKCVWVRFRIRVTWRTWRRAEPSGQYSRIQKDRGGWAPSGSNRRPTD